MSHSSSKLLILLSLFCNFVLSQTTTVTLTPQTQANAIIGLDRKNWNGGSTALHSQGYAHDFTLPASPGPCFKITSIRVLVDVNAPIVNNAPGCDHTELYYNLYQNNTYSGGATANFFKERRANPGVDFTTTTYTCTDPLWNSNFGGTFSVDVIPVYTTTCPNGQNAINAGFVAYTYTITLTVTYGEVTCAGTGCLAPSASTPAGCGNLAPTATVIQPTCLTGGSITVNPGPSGPTYAYAWSGGLPSTRTPTNVPPDTYTVTVTRTGTSCSGTTSVTLNPPSPISVIATPTPTTCGLNNGSITVSPGPTGHTYAWSPSASTAKDRTGLGPGPYTVTVTQTSTGCKGTSSVTVDPSTGFLATATRINPTCGLSNGSIQVNTLPTGLGYTYSWTGSLSGDNPQNLGSGTYTVTVTQTSTGCTRSVTSSLSLQSGALAVIDSIKQPNCGQNNGSILLTQTIGRTFSWTSGLSGNNPQNLAPGTYTVTVTQTSTGCTKIIPYTLNPSSPLAVTTTKTDPACGQNNGSILVSTGPTGYVYSWTGGLTGHNPTNLAAGTYIVTVTPTSGGCMEIDTVVLNNINPTSAPLFDPIPPICQGIIITLPTTSKDSISGVWTPPFNTNVATLYTFKPDSIKFPCAIDTNMMILVIPPSKPTISVFAPICQLDSSFSLNTTQTGITGIWSGSGVANNRFDPNPGGPGNFKLIFTPDTNQCADSASTLITVFPAALLPNPSLGAACVLSPAITLPDSIGNVPGTWTFNTSPIKIFDPKVLGEGSYILKFNPKAGYCAFPVDVPLAVKPFNAGADSTNVICALNNQTLNLNSWLSMGHSQGGIWRINQDTISNPAAFDLKNLSAGTVRFRYILSDPACGIDTAEITMIVSVPNNAGQDSIYTICQGATALLNLSDLTKNPDTGGKWSQISGTSVNLSDSTKVNISGLSGSQNIFRYIVPADVCPADTSLITISVTPFLTAGTDQTATFCSGSQVNLLSQINTSNNTGSFLNVNNTPGLSGTIWNTSAIPAGNYRFQYIITNAAPCKNDTADLQFIVTSSITAGQDKLDTKFCDGETLNLASYLSANATSGGQFYQNSTIIPNGTFPTGAPLNYTMYYVVGDSISCPRDTAFFTFSKIVKPLATLSGLSDLCENLCQKIVTIYEAW